MIGSFAATGLPPDDAAMAAEADGYGTTAEAILGELHREDYLALDADGRIRAAYPFSAVPTAHRVRLPSGVTAHAMCAVDALGIPAMLGTDLTTTSADPQTGQPITVSFTTGEPTWEPSTGVVFVGQRGADGAAIDICCSYLNFFTDSGSAATWIDANPEVNGVVLDRRQAQELGETTFGPLMYRP